MSMFCFQCEQTARGFGCTAAGVCGKSATTANLQDKLTGKMVALAKAAAANPTELTNKLLVDGLFTTVTNVNFNEETLIVLCNQLDAARSKYPNTSEMDVNRIWEGDEDTRSLKSLLLFGLRGMSAYAHHARVLGKNSAEVNAFFYKGLSALSEDLPLEKLLDLVMELGRVNLTCMQLLDTANTEAYGTPAPAKVSCDIEPGPFIIITGHDLRDLKLLLEQTEGKGINIYTHSEMLPAHGYPELKKYAHLKGNFGTAWQSQQKEFENIPAPVLFTTNCLMPVRSSYADRVFTTSVVSYPDMTHIAEDEQGHKDFAPVIRKALELGGYGERRAMTGINGGNVLTTGFGHGAVLSLAAEIVSAVRNGSIKHFFLVGGCDGARVGRNYYTEFVKATPPDTIILTLACGKYRFNDLDLGQIAGLPRILDMGQCNDAYSAINVALTLAEAFDCQVNDLPLSLVLSWYEQKAVCILLTLLALGIKKIYLGPSLPAFVSPNILKILVEQFELTPISSPEVDLNKLLG